MTSEKKILANQKNAQNAGVKSNEGRSRVRHNAFKHGLTSRAILSDFETLEETQDLYREIVEGLKESFCPQSYIEESLIDSMARAILKNRRYDRVEADLFREHRDCLMSHKERIELNKTAKLELILKYKHSIDAQYYRALEYLLRVREVVQLDLFLPEEKTL